jgi:hypothetical protein
MRAVLFVLLVVWATDAQATMVVYENDDDLFAKAGVVMVGKVWRWEIRQTPFFEVTDYELEALECFKGCERGQFLIMSVPGVQPGRGDTPHEEIAGAPHAEVGENLIVYLHRTPAGEHALISLGLSQFKLRYDAIQRRYMAHRQIEALALMARPSGPARDGQGTVYVPKTRLASEVLLGLRKKAGR